MFRLFRRVSLIIFLFLVMVGSAYFISDTMKYTPMKEVILKDYENFSFYSEDIESLPYELVEILALQNLEYHRFNKKESMESTRLNQKLIEPFSLEEVEEIRTQVSQKSGEIYDEYFFKGFLNYINKTNGIVIILVFVEIVRFTLEERRRSRGSARK